MPTSFQQLRDLPLGPLDAAVESWATAVRQMDALEEEGRTGMVARARRATWEGETARAARRRITQVSTQFRLGHAQARGVHRLLSDFVEAMRDLQRRLTELQDIAASQRFAFGDDGRLIDQENRDEGQTSAEMSYLRGSLQQILAECEHCDEVVTRGLHEISGDQRERFDSPGWAGLEAALHRDAIRDAEQALELLAQDELSVEDLARLDELLAEHQDDEIFASRLIAELGPDGLVDFWTDLESGLGTATGLRWDDPEERMRQLRGLQEHLGTVLGSATRSDIESMREWESDLLSQAQENPRTFQVVSALMHNGDYEADFLAAYGDALIEFERERDNGGTWEATSPSSDFNFLHDDDLGSDPMIGFLEATGRNPDAATGYFAPPEGYDPSAPGAAEVNERLYYLAVDREWQQGGASPEDSRATLGDALFAATTGLSTEIRDAESLAGALGGDMRTQETAAVMEQVVDLYSARDLDGDRHAEGNLLDEHPEMGRSLGQIASAYIDDLTYWGGAQFDVNREGFEELFVPPYGERLSNGYDSVAGFLSALGRNEAAHQVVTPAAHLYTVTHLMAHEPTDVRSFEEGVYGLTASARVRDLLDQARIDQVMDDFEEGSEDAEEAYARSGSWSKAIVNTGITSGLAYATVVGATGGGAAILVPVAAAGAGTILGEMNNQGWDAFLGDGEDPQREQQAIYDADGFQRMGRAEINDLANRYSNLAEGNGVDWADRQGVLAHLERAYQVDAR